MAAARAAVSDPQRVLALLQVRRYEDALAEGSRQLAAEPEDVDLLGLVALAHSKLERFDWALYLAHQAVRCAPETAYPHRMLAIVQDDAKFHLHAIASARTAVQLDPDDAANWRVLAECASRVRRAEGAAAARRAIELEPWHPGGHHALGMNLRGRQRTQAYRRALELDPNMAPTQANLAQALERTDPSQAAELLAGLVRSDPRRHDAHRRLLGIASRRRTAWVGVALGALVAVVALIWLVGQPTGADLGPGVGYAVGGGVAVGASVWTLWRTAASAQLLRQVREVAEDGARASFRPRRPIGPAAADHPPTAAALRRRDLVAAALLAAALTLVVVGVAVPVDACAVVGSLLAIPALAVGLRTALLRRVLRAAAWQEEPVRHGMRSGVSGIFGPWLLEVGTGDAARHVRLNGRGRRWLVRNGGHARVVAAAAGRWFVISLPGRRRMVLATTSITPAGVVKDAARFREVPAPTRLINRRRS